MQGHSAQYLAILAQCRVAAQLADHGPGEVVHRRRPRRGGEALLQVEHGAHVRPDRRWRTTCPPTPSGRAATARRGRSTGSSRRRSSSRSAAPLRRHAPAVRPGLRLPAAAAGHRPARRPSTCGPTSSSATTRTSPSRSCRTATARSAPSGSSIRPTARTTSTARSRRPATSSNGSSPRSTRSELYQPRVVAAVGVPLRGAGSASRRGNGRSARWATPCTP